MKLQKLWKKLQPNKNTLFTKYGFSDYIIKKSKLLPNWPTSAIEQLIYSHYLQAKRVLNDKDPRTMTFTNIYLSTQEIYKLIYNNDLNKIDSIGKSIFTWNDNRKTWLMKYMLENGTWPTEIIVRIINNGKYFLVEGHRRLGYLRNLYAESSKVDSPAEMRELLNRALKHRQTSC